MSQQPHIAVIGAGFAGLTAAVAAARSGALVTVYEATKEAGGRARTAEVDGYRFNLGPHALYRGAATVLRDLGVDIPGGTPNVAGVAYSNGKLHRLPVSAWSLVGTGLLGPLDKAEFGRVMAGLRRADPGEWHHRTVREWVESASERPQVRALLHAIMRLATYTDAPDDFSAGAALAQFDGATDVLYVNGGWQTLTNQLQAMVAGAGGTFVHGAHIDAVQREGDVVRVVGRSTSAANASTALFDSVVITGAPAGAASILGRHASGAVVGAAESSVSARASILDLGLSELPRPRRKFGLGIDRPLYLSVHSAAAQALAPAGGATLNVARYTRPGESVANDQALADLLAWADAAQPGWRECEVTRRFYPDLTVINAIPLAVRGGLPGRLKTDESGVPGVFIAGDWVGPTGLLADAATASGVAAGKAAAAWVAERQPAAGVA